MSLGDHKIALPFSPDSPTLRHRCSRVTIVTIAIPDLPCAKSMPAIITVDTSTSPDYIHAHPSTYGLTTLLLNNQLVLIEVQGTLEYNVTNGEEPRDVRLGDITWDETASRAYLHIGHHRMIGRLQSLKNPLAVLLDRPTNERSFEDKEWQLHTVIKKKLVFDIRPEPVFPDQLSA